MALGYEPGTADGLMGRRTRSALRAFQRAHGLAPSGQIDDATRAALGLPAKPAPRPGTEAPGEAGTPDAKAARAANGGADERHDGRAGSAGGDAGERAGAARKGTGDEGERSGALADGGSGGVATDASPSTLIEYEDLGWRPPASAEAVIARFRASRDAPIRERINESLIVPDGERIYLLDRGEQVPDLPCDPAAGAMRVDPMLFPGGPVLFTPLDEQGICQLGLGIVLQSGRILRFGGTSWPEGAHRAGRVRVGPTGLHHLPER